MTKQESPTWQGEAKGNAVRQINNTAPPVLCQQSPAPPEPDKSLTYRQRLKNRIISLACWGLIPIAFADWIVKRLEVGHA